MGRGRLISTAFVARPRHEVNARACKITGNGTHRERRLCNGQRPQPIMERERLGHQEPGDRTPG